MSTPKGRMERNKNKMIAPSAVFWLLDDWWWWVGAVVASFSLCLQTQQPWYQPLGRWLLTKTLGGDDSPRVASSTNWSRRRYRQLELFFRLGVPIFDHHHHAFARFILDGFEFVALRRFAVSEHSALLGERSKIQPSTSSRSATSVRTFLV